MLFLVPLLCYFRSAESENRCLEKPFCFSFVIINDMNES